MPSPSSRPGRHPDPAASQPWQQRLERFRRSGLTVRAFCDREGVSTASFYAWRRHVQHTPTPPTADTPRLGTPPASAPAEMLLPSGLVLRLPPSRRWGRVPPARAGGYNRW
jgi:transposase